MNVAQLTFRKIIPTFIDVTHQTFRILMPAVDLKPWAVGRHASHLPRGQGTGVEQFHGANSLASRILGKLKTVLITICLRP